MTGMIREHVGVGDFQSLDSLIAELEAVRRALPEGASDTRVRLRGDDVFGRHIDISYLRPKAQQEIECDHRAARFADGWQAGTGDYRSAAA